MRRFLVVLVLLLSGCEGEETAPPAPDAGGIFARGAEWSHGRIEPVELDGGL